MPPPTLNSEEPHKLETKADSKSNTEPFPLDTLLRCEAVNPEQRSHHGPHR